MTSYGPGGRIRVAANVYFPAIASPAFVFRKRKEVSAGHLAA